MTDQENDRSSFQELDVMERRKFLGGLLGFIVTAAVPLPAAAEAIKTSIAPPEIDRLNIYVDLSKRLGEGAGSIVDPFRGVLGMQRAIANAGPDAQIFVSGSAPIKEPLRLEHKELTIAGGTFDMTRIAADNPMISTNDKSRVNFVGSVFRTHKTGTPSMERKPGVDIEVGGVTIGLTR